MANFQISRLQQKLRARAQAPLNNRIQAVRYGSPTQGRPNMVKSPGGLTEHPQYGQGGGARQPGGLTQDPPMAGGNTRPGGGKGGHGGGKKPGPTPLPFDATYDSTISSATRDRDMALQNNAYEQQRLQSAYGFDNPAANPYSRAALLTKSYQQRDLGSINSMAARGQLYSGSTQNALNTNLDEFGQAYDAARTSYEDELRAVGDKSVQAQNAYSDTASQALSDALARALDQDVDPLYAPEKQKKGGKGKGKGGGRADGRFTHEPTMGSFTHKPSKPSNKNLRTLLRKMGY